MLFKLLRFLVGACLVGVLLLVSNLLFACALITGLVVGIARAKLSKDSLALFIWTGILIVVSLAAYSKFWPAHSNTESCSTSALPLVGALRSPAPYAASAEANVRSKSQVELYLERFDARSFEQLQDAKDSEEGFGRVHYGFSVLNNLAKIRTDVDLGSLNDRIQKLQERLSRLAKPGESKLDAIRKRRLDLQAYLADYTKRSRSLEEKDIAEFEKQFSAGLLDLSLENIHGDIAAVDAALTTDLNKVLGSDLEKRIDAESTLSAALNEAEPKGAASSLELRESLHIKINDAEISQIDGSSLDIGSEVLRSRLRGAQQRFELYFEGKPNSGQARPILDVIQVPRGTRDIEIRSILTLPVNLTDTCIKSPVLRFQMLRVSWPEPYPAALTALVNLTGTKILNYPYRFESRMDSTIQEIELPARSFFASNFEFKVERVADTDQLKPNDPDRKLNLEYFRSRSIWIELLPQWARYGWVQKHKELLFRDNAISFVFSLWFGSLCAMIGIKRNENSE